MRELMDEMKNDGIEVNSFSEMPLHAGPKWSAMSAEQRRPYEEMVSDSPSNCSVDRPMGRMNNHRELIADRAQEELDKKYRKAARENECESIRRNWPPGNALIKEKFQLIHFEYFIKTQDDEYLPCEVGLIEFSMEEGIIRKFQSYIDPGPCPRGYMYEERLRSEQRHQIPCCERFKIPHFSDEERSQFKDHKKILQEILDFTSVGGTVSHPRVFTFGDDIEPVMSCLDYLVTKAKGDKFDLPRVLPLEHLLPQFYLHSTRVFGPAPSINSCQRILTQSVWDYESGISCSFHEDVETRFCALGQVHRWCFAIFDAMKMPIVEEDPKSKRQDPKKTKDIPPIFDFTLTERHLPTPSKSCYTVLNSEQLIDAEYRKSIARAIKPKDNNNNNKGDAASSSVANGESTTKGTVPAPEVSTRQNATSGPAGRRPSSDDTSGVSSLRQDVRNDFRQDALLFNERNDDDETDAKGAIADSRATVTSVSVPSHSSVADATSSTSSALGQTKAKPLGRGFNFNSAVAQVGAVAMAEVGVAAMAATKTKPSFMNSFGRGRGSVKRSC